MTAWYDKATFYHMYPLGMTGSPFANPYPVSDGAADGTNRDVSADSRMDELMLWIPYLESLHISAIYIGPLFESSTHGYDTRDFRLIDRRLGTNVSFRSFVDCCHEHGIRVVVDGVSGCRNLISTVSASTARAIFPLNLCRNCAGWQMKSSRNSG